MSKATQAPGGSGWLTTTDHKRIALQFLWWTWASSCWGPSTRSSCGCA